MLIGIRDYAKHRGVAVATVRDAVNYGRITPEMKNGRMFFDPEKCDKEWADNTNEAQARGPQSAENFPAFQKSRAIREAYNARITKLEYEKKLGKLIEVEKVRRQSENTASIIKNSLNQLPLKLAAQLAAETDPHEIEMIIVREIEDCLEELSRYETRY